VTALQVRPVLRVLLLFPLFLRRHVLVPRTRLPPLGAGLVGEAAGAAEGPGIRREQQEGVIHVLLEATHRHTGRPIEPGARVRADLREREEQRNEGLRLDPRQAPLVIAVPKLRDSGRHPLQAEKRPRAPRREAETLACVGLEAREPGSDVEAPVGDLPEQRADPRLELLLEGHDLSQATIELEGVGVREPFEQLAHEQRWLRADERACRRGVEYGARARPIRLGPRRGRARRGVRFR
jgi:hypothetical protein